MTFGGGSLSKAANAMPDARVLLRCGKIRAYGASCRRQNCGRMSTTRQADLVIWGVTRDGRPFRPSDWCDRLAGLVSVFGSDQRLAYSPLVRPVTVAGVRAVVVGRALEVLEPRLYAFLAGFARDNELQSTDVEDALVAPQRLVPPARPPGAVEPREPV